MPSLRSLQRAFTQALRGEADEALLRHVVRDGFTSEERFGIYRNSCRSVLVGSLRLAYPAVQKLVGRDFFDEAAARFALARPPFSGCLDDYGAGFARFLARFEPAEALAYLPDVARYEWALAAAAHADDAPALDAKGLRGIDAARHAALRFVAHPSTRLLALDYPADHIADAVLAGDDAAMAEIDLASGPVHLVVHRGRQGVESERIDAAAYEFLAALIAGLPWERVADLSAARAGALLAHQLVKGRLADFDAGPGTGECR